jgi:hypothetical protein
LRGSAGDCASELLARDGGDGARGDGGKEAEGVACLRDSRGAGTLDAEMIQVHQAGDVVHCAHRVPVLSEAHVTAEASPHDGTAEASPQQAPAGLARRGHACQSPHAFGVRQVPRALAGTECEAECERKLEGGGQPVATFTPAPVPVAASLLTPAAAGGLSAGGARRDAHVEMREDSISWYKRLVAGAAGGEVATTNFRL